MTGDGVFFSSENREGYVSREVLETEQQGKSRLYEVPLSGTSLDFARSQVQRAKLAGFCERFPKTCTERRFSRG